MPDDALLSDERLHDGEADDLSGSDLEPPAQVQDAAPRLQALIADAQRLSGKAGDPKLAALIRHIDLLVKDGYHPVVFCRYIATAHYVAEHIKAAFPKATVDAVTGELTPEERRERVDDMEDAEQRILVATDCLSEGINLQHLFAVFRDRLEIRSPGKLYGGLTFDEIRQGNISCRRNPKIAELLRRIHLVEAWGRGVPLILENAPDASFLEIGGLFITRFARPSAAEAAVEADARTGPNTGTERPVTGPKTRAC